VRSRLHASGESRRACSCFQDCRQPLGATLIHTTS
jgi:hypothetical protein